MKKQIFFSLLFATTFIINAQIKVTAGKHQYKFFKSYEDYKTDKPVDGIKINSWKPSSVEYTENGASQKAKISKLPYPWFCNDGGMLMRVFDEDLYYVVVDGALFFYIKAKEGSVTKPDNADYIITGNVSDSYPSEYYSLNANGPIEKLKDKVLEEYLTKYSLTSQYENDPQYQREKKDCVMCWQNKKTNKKIKYVKLINEKMK